MTGLLPTDQTVLWYVSPDGVVLHLSGRPDAGREGVWLGTGPDGLGHVEVTPIFEAAARQHGETYVGETVDHGEIDLPVFVLGDTVDEFRRRREWVAELVERRRRGWLAAYTSSGGWTWVAVRKVSFKPAYEHDPAILRGGRFDLLLAAESPLARQADDTDEWVNTAGTGRGELALYPGPGEWPAWPQFVIRGPGAVRLRWAGNDVTLPVLKADEWALVNSDEARPTIRGRDARGVERNLWPSMKPGQRIPNPLPPRQVSRVEVSASGASTATGVWATVPVQREGLI